MLGAISDRAPCSDIAAGRPFASCQRAEEDNDSILGNFSAATNGPELLQPFADRVEWFGPPISPEQLPRFELAHQAGKTTYLNFFMGAEANHSPVTLPPDLSSYRYIHIAPLGESQRQLEFLLACRECGARRISVSTFARAAHEETEMVRELLDQADLFFMNEDEATHVFGSVADATTRPGKLLFVTLGERVAKSPWTTFAPRSPI